MQSRLEEILKTGLENARSKSGSVVVYDPNTGAIKAMANYPTYNPAEYQKVEDISLFTNTAVSSPLEVGSIMKTLTAAAALDNGSVTTNTSYFDPGYVIVGDRKITNIEEDGGAATQTVKSILQLSLNTGAVYLLKSMGDGQINEKARNTWYDYMFNRYQLGKPTGVEQAEEVSSYGDIPKPEQADGINVQYATTAFGQGMTATPLQMAAALGAVVNGGTYYKPRVVERVLGADGSIKRSGPIVVKKDIVKPDTGKTLVSYMEYVVIIYLLYVVATQLAAKQERRRSL
jgi:cell division protein FtsI/penicillin-binding protein 2